MAFFLALIWAVHPIQVSSVLYVVQRMQTLGSMFIILSLIAYLSMRTMHMKGQSGRKYGFLTLLFVLLGFACKEDSVMAFCYMFILELTILNFSAKDVVLSNKIKRVYISAFSIGVLLYFFVVIPYYWSWDEHSVRNFSTPERLLTRGRVLILYLYQILVPLPSLMSFFYDGYLVSKGLFAPVYTFFSWLIILLLLLWAFFWRRKRSLFSCGVLLFFAGHFVTSNVVPLELVFEHRNHFALIGVLLVMADLIIWLLDKKYFKRYMPLLVGVFIVSGVAGLGAWRSYIWGDNLRMAQYTLELAPESERAWTFLCNTYFERSENNLDNLDKAIEACQAGADKLPFSAILSNNVIIYKTQRGTVTQEDWDKFLERLIELN